MNEMNWRDVKIDRRENKGSTFWYLGSGELPRFGREHNQTVFYSRDLGTVGEENEKDEFIVPLMSISGIFDSPLSDEQLVAYFQAREQSYINLLVLEAKKKFPKLKNEDFESYVVVRQDPLVFEDRFAYEEVCIFICVDKKIKTSKKMDLYEISKSYDIVASWEKTFAISLMVN